MEFITLNDYVNLYQLRPMSKLMSSINRETCLTNARKIALSVDEVWFLGNWNDSSVCNAVLSFCEANNIAVKLK